MVAGSTDSVLAIDIGATTIKSCVMSRDGEQLEVPRRRATPYPCTPARLVEVVTARVLEGGNQLVGVGFPGDFADGVVCGAGNLNRPGGTGTEVDPDLTAQWIGFHFQDALRATTGRDVRVVNDATLAAMGCCDGVGVELVVTLGTGVGLAMQRDGLMVRVRDVGQAPFLGGRTYDQNLGERARAEDPDGWLDKLDAALRGFADEFGARVIHLAGGNARRVPPGRFADLPVPVQVSGNDAPLRGAAKLFA